MPEDIAFNSWYRGWADRTGINPDPNDPKHQYDYKKAYDAGVDPKISEEDGKYHWPSEYKGDNHPTRFKQNDDGEWFDTRNSRVVSNPSQDEEYLTWKNNQPLEQSVEPTLSPAEGAPKDGKPTGINLEDAAVAPDENVEAIPVSPADLESDIPEPLYTIQGIDYSKAPTGERRSPNYWRNVWNEMANVGTQVGGFVADFITGVTDIPRTLDNIGREIARAYTNVTSPESRGIIQTPEFLAEQEEKQAQWIKDIREVGDRGREAQTEQLTRVLTQGGVPAAVATQLAGTLWRTSFNLLMMRGVNGALPTGASGPTGKAWTQTLRNAARFAAFRYATTPGTNEEKLRAAQVSFMYMATPAISSNVGLTEPLTKLFDFALNTGVSFGTGAYKDARIQAEELAKANDEDPSDFKVLAKYLAITATPTFATDIYFSSITKSNRQDIVGGDSRLVALVNQVQSMRFGEVKHKVQNVYNVRDKVGLEKALNASGDGKTRYRAIDPTTTAGAEVISADKLGSITIREGTFGKKKTYDVYQLKQLGGRESATKARPSGTLLGGESPRVQALREQASKPDVPNETPAIRPLFQRVTEESDAENAMRDVVETAKRSDGFAEVSDLYVKLISDGSIKKPSGAITKDKMIADVQEFLQGDRMPTDVAITKPEYRELPKDIAKLKGFSDILKERSEGFTKIAERLEKIREPLPREDAEGVDIESVRLEKSTRAFVDELSKGIVIEDERPHEESLMSRNRTLSRLDNAIDALNRVDYTPETVDAVIDGMAGRSYQSIESMDRQALNSRLHKILGSHEAVKDALAAKFDLEEGFSMKDLPDQMLSALARNFPETDIVGIDKTTAEIMKALYWADGAEAGIKAANGILRSKGESTFAAIDRSFLLDQATPDFTLSPTERKSVIDMTPMKFKEKPFALQAMNEVMDQMKRPLPDYDADPKSFEKERRRIMQLAISRRDRIEQARDGGMKFFTKVWDRTLDLQSMRYNFHGLSAATGNFEFSRSYETFFKEAKRGNFDSDNRVKMIFPTAQGRIDDGDFFKEGKPYTFTDAKQSDVTKWEIYIQTHPEVERAMKVILGTDRDTSVDTDAGKELAKSRAILGFKLAPSQRAYVDSLKGDEKVVQTKNAEQLREIVNNMGAELQGATAANTRMLQVMRWGEFWEKNGEQILLLESLKRTGELGKGKVDTLNKLLEAEDDIRPLYKEEGKKSPTKTERRTLIEGYKLLSEHGEEVFHNWAAKEKFGTRRNYYALTKDFVSSLRPDLGSPEKGLTESRMMKELRMTGAVNTRTGFGVLSDEPLMSTFKSIVRNREVQARTYRSGQKIQNLLNEYTSASIPQNERLVPEWVKTGIETWMNSEWGHFQPTGRIVGGVRRMARAWWTLYPLSVTRAAWYNTRNLFFQGAPWGPVNTQYNPIDVASQGLVAFAKFQDKGSNLRKYIDESFKKDISQRHELINQQFRQLSPSEQEKTLWKSKPATFYYLDAWARQLSSAIMSFSDDKNRLTVSSIGYTIGEKWINKYITDPKFTAGDLQDKLKIDSLHPVEQTMLMDKFHDAVRNGGTREAFEGFLRDVTEIKNTNINYIYSLGGRSPAEQNPTDRILMGVTTYPRGSIERFVQNGIAPLKRIFAQAANGDMSGLGSREFFDAIGNIGTQMFVHTFTTVLASYLIGEKQRFGIDEEATDPTYSLVRSATYSPIAPGFNAGLKMLNKAKKSLNALWSSEEQEFASKSEALWEGLLYYVPIANDIANWAEMVNNTEGAKNARFLSTLAEEKGYFTDRNIHKSIMHGLIGTFELPDKRSLGERVIDASIYPLTAKKLEELID